MRELRKRSLLVAGRETSVALEPEFWSVLEAMAAEDGRTMAATVTAIDAARGERSLASACRLAALDHARRRL